VTNVASNAVSNAVPGPGPGASQGEKIKTKNPGTGPGHTARVRARGQQDSASTTSTQQPAQPRHREGSRTGRKAAKTVVIPPGRLVAITAPEAQAYLAECAAKGIAPNYG